LTTNRTTGVADGKDADSAAVLAARASVPNDTDFVITPVAAACYACHDGVDTVAHMEQNGAVINDNRSDVLNAMPVETCSLCHGTGKIEDLEPAHAAEEFTVVGIITAPPTDGEGGDSQSQVELCGPGPISAQPAGHTDSLSCCSCHSFN
jgi:hypothetical protein